LTAFKPIVSERRIALLIDADNVARHHLAAIIAELSRHGVANIRRAYGDWASDALKKWKETLHEHAVRPVQQFVYSTGKNATDIALAIDAMELLYTQKLDAFAIASSDADFTPLVMQLRANGYNVYGFGERKTPEPFVNACSTFLYLESLEDVSVPEAKEKPSATSQVVPSIAVKSDANPERPISQDTKLVSVLRGAVEATASDNGWANLAAAGSAVKRQAPIDPRNYGMKNFPKLFEATGLFEIVKEENGHGYVADKRNKGRTPKPR
jgi:uncharacterized protein (TIGR00288 family)